MYRITVFCGSATGNRPEHLETATRFGQALAERDIGLVYGGATIGLMAAVADACLAAGGEIIGVIPKALTHREIAHRELTELRVVESMHERKAMMAELAQGFIALPGGFGTLDELCEVITWAQIGIHNKPIAILNTSGYFDGFLDFIATAEQEGFVRPAHRDLFFVAETADEAISGLQSRFQPLP